jgi:hypothetical protein
LAITSRQPAYIVIEYACSSAVSRITRIRLRCWTASAAPKVLNANRAERSAGQCDVVVDGVEQFAQVSEVVVEVAPQGWRSSTRSSGTGCARAMPAAAASSTLTASKRTAR